MNNVENLDQLFAPYMQAGANESLGELGITTSLHDAVDKAKAEDYSESLIAFSDLEDRLGADPSQSPAGLLESLAQAQTSVHEAMRHHPAIPDGLPALPPNPMESVAPVPIDSINFDALAEEYTNYFEQCEIRSEHVSTLAWYRNRLLRNKARYEEVAAQSNGVPWYCFGVIHGLECSFSFQKHLHNGDPLTARTTRVPDGHPESGSPPFPWEVSAVDALAIKKFGQDWSLPRLLHNLEAYNGFGYRPKRVPSPYLWGFSTHYIKGKFVRDHVYDPSAVSKQCGAAVILKLLENEGEIQIPRHQPAPAVPVPLPAPAPPPLAQNDGQAVEALVAALDSEPEPPREEVGVVDELRKLSESSPGLNNELAMLAANYRQGEELPHRVASRLSPDQLGEPEDFQSMGENVFERIIDENDLVPVTFLELGAQRQRSVARVVLTKPHSIYPPGRGWATGFMISPTLFLTNNHVISEPRFLKKIRIQFNYQLGLDGSETHTDSFLAVHDDAFHTNPSLDYTVVRLQPASGENPGEKWGFVELNDEVQFRSGHNFNIIQHPDGRRKEVALQNSQLQAVFNNAVHYTADTEPGSSGSPVFDNLWQLVALHHAGGEYDEHAGKWLTNEGIRIDRIVEDLRAHFQDKPMILDELGIA